MLFSYFLQFGELLVREVRSATVVEEAAGTHDQGRVGHLMTQDKGVVVESATESLHTELPVGAGFRSCKKERI